MRNHHARAPDRLLEVRPARQRLEVSGGVQGKYAEAYWRGTNLARLDPDVAQAFKTDRAVNDALRAILRVAPKACRAPGRAREGSPFWRARRSFRSFGPRQERIHLSELPCSDFIDGV